MNICFIERPRKRNYEAKVWGYLTQALKEYYPEHKCKTVYLNNTERVKKLVAQYDLVCLFGCGSQFKEISEASQNFMVVDKGYVKTGGLEASSTYYKISVNSLQPISYFNEKEKGDKRWRKLKKTIKPYKKGSGKTIVFAGSSKKYCEWYGLGTPHEYAMRICGHLRKLSNKKIVYRPKPSMRDNRGIKHCEISTGGALSKILPQCYCLVTYGSNSCVECVWSGVPTIVLGEGLSRGISSNKVEDINNLYIPSRHKQQRFLNNMAYCQWTTAEMRKGKAWKHIFKEVLPSVWREHNEV